MSKSQIFQVIGFQGDDNANEYAAYEYAANKIAYLLQIRTCERNEKENK